MGNQSFWYLALALAAGALGAIHVPLNGALGTRISSAVVATFTFYGVAFLAIAAITLLSSERESLRALSGVPAWYYLVPGLISVAVVGSNTFLIPRLGAIEVFVVTITAQIVVRSVISHFGWFASPQNPIDATQVLGAALVVSGAFLVVRP